MSLPFATDNGGWDWPEGAAKSPLRTYTVRDIRRDGGQVEVDIDFVVHDGGIAATWAQRAAPGDVVGLNSPNPLYDPPEDLDWQFLIADQAGLPAAGRLLAATPAHVRTKVVIEVPDAEHQQPLPTGPHIDVTWIHGGNGHGPSRLDEVVRSAPTPAPTPATSGSPAKRPACGRYASTSGTSSRYPATGTRWSGTGRSRPRSGTPDTRLSASRSRTN